MVDKEKLSVNNYRMRKNEALTSAACVTYLAAGLMLTAANLCLWYIYADFWYIVNAAFSGAVMVLGYLGGYCRNNTFAIGAPVVAAVSIPVTGNLIYIILAVMSAVLLVMTIRANTVYEELSHEPGFPQFSLLFEEQKMRSEEADRQKAEYLERQRNVAFSDINDLGAASAGTEKKSDISGSSGYMDSI